MEIIQEIKVDLPHRYQQGWSGTKLGIFGTFWKQEYEIFPASQLTKAHAILLDIGEANGISITFQLIDTKLMLLRDT